MAPLDITLSKLVDLDQTSLLRTSSAHFRKWRLHRHSTNLEYSLGRFDSFQSVVLEVSSCPSSWISIPGLGHVCIVVKPIGTSKLTGRDV